MKSLVFVALLGCLITSREAAAQSFWYVPPGYGYGNYYGADLGNGVGFGYGIGVGIPVSPSLLNSSKTDTYIPPFQELCDSNPSFISRDVPFSSPNPAFSNVPKKTAKTPAKKKSVSKITHAKAKPVNQTAK